MNFKIPKNTDKIYWTKHSIEKMKFYGLTPQRVLRIIKSPQRREEAIVENCVACMQSIGNKKKTEIWTIYQDVIKDNKKLRKIITAWRYPCVSPKKGKIIIPEDILEDINLIIK